MTHICVSKLIIICSDNGLTPGRRQAIIWNNGGILSIGTLGTNFSEILVVIYMLSLKKCFWKCQEIGGLFVLTSSITNNGHHPSITQRQTYDADTASPWTRPRSTHCSGIIMRAMVSQITSMSTVHSTVCSGAHERKHQTLRVTGLCGGNPPVTDFCTNILSTVNTVAALI